MRDGDAEWKVSFESDVRFMTWYKAKVAAVWYPFKWRDLVYGGPMQNCMNDTAHHWAQ